MTQHLARNGPSPFAYAGPPELRESVRLALSWVFHPETGRNLLREAVVLAVRLGAGKGVVQLALADSPVARVIAEDLQCELWDRLQGRWAISVVLVQRSVVTLAAG